MSGYKRATITITREEFERLRDAERAFRTIPEISSESLHAIIEQSSASVQENIQDIQRRQEAFQELLGGLDGSIRQFEAASSRKLAAYQAAAAEQAKALAGNLWDHFQSVIGEQNRAFSAALQENQRQAQADLAFLYEEFQQLAAGEQRKYEIAAQWLSSAEQYWQFLQETYPVDLFLSGRFFEPHRQLEQARRNLGQGLPESALQMVQQSFFTLSDLRMEMEHLLNEWHVLALATWETANQLLSQAAASEYVRAYDLDGNPLPYEVSVDFWSGGKLSALTVDINRLLDQLSTPAVFVDSATLRQWLEVDLPGYCRQLEDLILDARIQALNSQLRINIADLVVRALGAQGFSVEREQASYEDGDERLSYHLRMVNLEGNEVVVQVAPTGDDLGQNELRLESLDHSQRTEHELRQRWIEVSRSLSCYGLDVGAYVREDRPQYTTNGSGTPSQPLKKLHKIQRASNSGRQHGD